MASIKQPFNPQALRGALLIILIAIMSGGAGLFYIGLNQLHDYAVQVNNSAAEAQASDDRVQSLQSLKNQLSQSQALVTKANQMFATPESYQAQANNDVSKYASAAGITITKTTFEAAVAGGSPVMNVTIKSPTSYSKLIQFLNGIEGNLPKMQVTSIALSHPANGGADSVTVDDIKIAIATR